MHEVTAFRQALVTRVEQCREFLKTEYPLSVDAIRQADAVLKSARDLQDAFDNCGIAADEAAPTMIRVNARNRVPFMEVVVGGVVIGISFVLKMLHYPATAGILITLMVMHGLHRMFVGKKRTKVKGEKQVFGPSDMDIVETTIIRCRDTLTQFRRSLGQIHISIVPDDIVDPLHCQRLSFEIASTETFLLTLGVAQSVLQLFTRLKTSSRSDNHAEESDSAEKGWSYGCNMGVADHDGNEEINSKIEVLKSAVVDAQIRGDSSRETTDTL